jgi:hypothetical protein
MSYSNESNDNGSERFPQSLSLKRNNIHQKQESWNFGISCFRLLRSFKIHFHRRCHSIDFYS